MYAAFYKKCLYPFYESVLRKRKTLFYLDELEKNQWLDEEALRQMQWEKLQRLLAYAREHVPYYRRVFQALGITPIDIRSVEDLSRLPLLTRDIIQQNQKDLLSDQADASKLIYKTTSGTTGTPLTFYYDRDVYERNMACLARANRWAGWDYGVKELYVWGTPPYKISWQRKLKEAVHHAILRRKKIDTFALSKDNLGSRIQEINRFQPKVIIGYTTTLYNIARYIVYHGITCHAPDGIVTTAEKLFPAQRAMIEKAFRTKVFDRYGCQEAMFLAAECDRHEGWHMNTDNYIIEIIKDGQPVRDEPGQVVFTDLYNYAMPFIRYRNGDLAVRSRKACSCGRGLPLLTQIEGRVVDTVVTPDNQIISGEVFLYIIDRFTWVKKYQIIQERKDFFVVKIAPYPGKENNQKDLETIRTEIYDVLGQDVGLDLSLVDEIPLTSSGKQRIVISKVPVDI